MNRYWLLLDVVIFSITLAHGQSIKGIVMDAETQLPIPYVNIGISGKNVGTVSLEDGSFTLGIATHLSSDGLTFSSIGYNKKHFQISQIPVSNFIVKLQPHSVILKELIFTDAPKSVSRYGHLPKSKYTKAGFVFNRLGHEIGTVVELKEEVAILDSVRLNFVECAYDSVLFRLNVYSIDGARIENILPKSIILSYSRKQVLSKPTIDLSSLALTV